MHNQDCFSFLFAKKRKHLFVQGYIVQSDPSLSSEVVGAVVAMLQHGPAVRGVWRGVTRVSWTSKLQESTGSAQTLRTGVIVV